MKDHSSHYIKNLLLPCLTFSVITGILSALIITAFQLAAKFVIKISVDIYSAVSSDPKWLPCLILGALAIGFISSLILSVSHNCRGGGIPTTIAAIQGVVSFKWLPSVLLLPFSALLSFICGIPLGTEGPSVQMGAGVGDGVVQTLGKKKHIGWRRYIMTGGASAGFSLVTGAPITSVIFSMEELHKRFSPLIFSVASISVVSSQITARMLSLLGIPCGGLFHIAGVNTLPISRFIIPLIIGLLCGGCAVVFTKIYHKIDRIIRVKLENVSLKIKIPVIFASVALIGFFLFEILGTGHSLIESIFERKTVWYTLIIIFLIRLLLMMISNTAGITGGIFLPTLAFGAIIGALCAEAFIGMGFIGSGYYLLLVVLGMTSFLGASSQIPMIACLFAVETMNGVNNIIPIIISTTAAFLIVELSGEKDLSDTVIEAKERDVHKGKKAHDIEVALTVYENSFVVGKNLRDILWPTSCVVLSINRVSNDKDKLPISVGDVITVYYKTYDPIATAEEFEILVGDQSEDIDRIMRPI